MLVINMELSTTSFVKMEPKILKFQNILMIVEYYEQKQNVQVMSHAERPETLETCKISLV